VRCADRTPQRGIHTFRPSKVAIFATFTEILENQQV
jgi:hypothetical protein